MRKGPKPVTPPEGYLSAAQAAARLGSTPWTVILLLRDGRLRGYRAPKLGQHERWWVEEASVTALRRQGNWHRPRGRHKAKATPVAPLPPPEGKGSAPAARNGRRPQAKVRAAAAPAADDRLWSLLEELEGQRRLWLGQLRTGVPEELADQLYVLARRSLVGELLLLARLYGEPKRVEASDAVDWLGDRDDEGDL